MRHALLFAPLLALAAPAMPALAAQAGKDDAPAAKNAAAEAQADASIPFANHGGIRDWRSEGSETVYIQDSARHWYKAVLFARAPDLPFAQAIGFETKGPDTFDRFSTIIVAGQPYPLKSLVRIAGEPPKAAHKGKAEEHAHSEHSSEG
ncbi:hypothetical protein AEB_P3178 [Altererythrobacter sp. B11]|uniref:DUF6491 family protein n=1 Tax=Altererythrobacter sp. B11 TaxID=2060312 RepID=UPI000DC6D375|nr:DUF6491 family protein [Altererythrobacter sp. B11]BBC74046.1 hypothetical protein AEB_P3178 [Altererythrobacter sp. B11]